MDKDKKKFRNIFVKDRVVENGAKGGDIMDAISTFAATNPTVNQNEEPVGEVVKGIAEAPAIWDWANLALTDNDIQRVKEFLTPMPETMDFESKKQMLAKMLIAARLDPGVLLQDGESKMQAIDNYGKHFTATIQSEIKEAESEIAELSIQIEAAKVRIKDLQNRQSAQNKVLDGLRSEIKETTQFI